MCVAVHASSRLPKWLEEVKRTAPAPLIALDDGTGIIFQNGEQPETIGPGKVWRV
jgi:hypothetical protein